VHRQRLGLEHRADHFDAACAAGKHLPRGHDQTTAGDHPKLDGRATEDDTRNSAPVDGAATHDARLGARVERRALERGGVQPASGLTREQQLGVTGWVRLDEDLVLRRQPHVAVDHEQRAERFVAMTHRLFGQGDALTDKRLVLRHRSSPRSSALSTSRIAPPLRGTRYERLVLIHGAIEVEHDATNTFEPHPDLQTRRDHGSEVFTAAL